jgi:hypothetical protein
MRVIIAGSRSINDYNLIEKCIKDSGFQITEVVSGGAYGVDKLGEKWARQNKVAIKQFIPKWNELGKRAGFVRNAEMGNYADAAVICYDGISSGTWNMYQLMLKNGKPCHFHDISANSETVKQKGDCGCDLSNITSIDATSINFDCKKVWKLLSDGNVQGAFQIESYLGKKLIKQLKPANIDHLAALIAIMRPGALESKLDDGKSIAEHYILRKNNKEPVEYFHPALENILKDTYGVLIYQEQSIQIGQELAGMTLEEADSLLRKGLGKKLPEVIAKAKKVFLEGCKKVGKVNEQEAETIFGWIEKGQRYQFNACLSPDCIVETLSGYKTLEELNIGDIIDSPYGPTTVVNKYDNGIKDIYEITFESGKTLKCTLDHELVCEDNIKRKLSEILKNPSYKIICEE